MKFSKAFDNFIRDRKLQACTTKTITNYVQVLTPFVAFVGDIDTTELTIEHVKDYNAKLIDRKISKASVATYLRHIKAFISYLEAEELIEGKSIAKRIKLPKNPKKQITLFTAVDMQMIFDGIDSKPEWIRLRNCVIVALMYDSGLRQSEVCCLMVEDLDYERKIIKVHGKGDKDRLVPLGATSLQLIEQYLAAVPFDTPYLLSGRHGEQMTNNSVKLFIAKLRKETGYTNLTSHKLRHNFATNFCIDSYERDGYVDNIKLSVLMGHEDLATTQIYMHEAQSYIATSRFHSHLDAIF